MNRYEPSTPRAALGMIAVAIATITMGVLVVLPAKRDSVSTDSYTLAATKAGTKAPGEAAIGPAGIAAPVVANREEPVHSNRTALGAQELRGNHHKLSLRSRAHI